MLDAGSDGSSADEAPPARQQPVQQPVAAKAHTPVAPTTTTGVSTAGSGDSIHGQRQSQDHKQLRAAIQAARQNLGLEGHAEAPKAAGPRAGDALQQAAPVLIQRTAKVLTISGCGKYEEADCCFLLMGLLSQRLGV